VSKKFLRNNELFFVPMNYTLGEEERVCRGMEDEDLLKKFYAGQRAGDLTHTSQITPQQYIDTFEKHLACGESVIYLSLSSGLTKTFDSVRIAKMDMDEKYPDAKIYPVDTLSATGGMGLLAELAVNNKKSGMSAAENAANLEEMSHKVCHIFMVEDLMYLKRGGRISAATAVVGTVMNIKPILVIDQEGKLITVAKKRGEKLALRELMTRYLDSRDTRYGKNAYITHADAGERPAILEEMLKRHDPSVSYTEMFLSPIIGAHTGPGMTAIIFFGDRAKICE
jgi:DegV family protein with EDD domain